MFVAILLHRAGSDGEGTEWRLRVPALEPLMVGFVCYNTPVVVVVWTVPRATRSI